MPPSTPADTARAPRAVLARVVKQEIQKLPGVIAMRPRLRHRLRRGAGVKLSRSRKGTVKVKVWIGVIHDAGAVDVGRRVQRAVMEAVTRTSGETVDRVIVVVAEMKLLRSPRHSAKGVTP